MNRIFSLTFLIPLSILAQTESHVLTYDVAVSMSDRSNEIAGTVHVNTQIVDAVSGKYTFLVPRQWTIRSLRDKNNDSYDLDRTSSSSINFDLITLDLTDNERQSDTLSLRIEFAVNFDSSSSGELFVNQKEFLLPCKSALSWLPHIGSLTADHFTLEFKLPAQFVVLSEEPFDTASSEGIRTWTHSSSTPSLLSSAFTLCGIQNGMKQTSFSSDSLISVSCLSSPLKFNQRFAAAKTGQLCDAIQFFSVLTKQQRISAVSYAFVGDGAPGKEIFSTKNFIIQKNSPANTVFDSSAIEMTSRNHWLIQAARRFCPASTDSTALFDDGFASYLAMRYIVTSFPSAEKQERFSTISNSLTFLPDGTLAAGHTSRTNTNEFISNRGRYFFLMLEYILGRESFDAVIAEMSHRFSETHITFEEFQSLCEEAYGSPLNWFFDEWLNRSTAPEYVMQWKSETTARGMSIITATIEQRGGVFTMPVPLSFSFGNITVTKRVVVEKALQEFKFTFPQAPAGVAIDPEYSVLRWLLEIRITAHAKTSLQYLTINRDVNNAEREALYTLQLDPNNSTGSAPLAYFVLGNIAAIGSKDDAAKEYFSKASLSFATEETALYTLLSRLRYANVLEKSGKREEAVAVYQQTASEGRKNPMIYERVIIEAEKYIPSKFEPQNDLWFDIH